MIGQPFRDLQIQFMIESTRENVFHLINDKVVSGDVYLCVPSMQEL